MFVLGFPGKVILGSNCLLILINSYLRCFGSIIWGVILPVVNVDRYDPIDSTSSAICLVTILSLV